MKITRRYFCVIVIGITFGLTAFAQQAETESIDELKSAIRKLESIDNNPATPPEIRDLNRTFLTERRTKLLSLLKERRQARKDYLTTALSALSTEQITKVEDEIVALDKTIVELQRSVSSNTTSATNPTFTTDPGNGSSTSPQPDPSPAVSDPTTVTTRSGAGNNVDVAVPTPVLPQQPATADSTPATMGQQFKALLGSAVNRIQTEKATNPRATVDLRNTFLLLAVSLTEETRKDVVAEFTAKAEEIKTDKQTGSSSANAGSTSLVAKASIPAVFGFAVENGALTRTDSKTGITFSGTPVGIIEALAKKGYIESYQNDDSFDRFLRNFSFKLTFDPNRGSTPGTFTGSGQQVSGYSLRYKLVDQRDPRDKKYTSQWLRLVETRAVPVTATLATFFRRLLLNPTPAFAAWRAETEAAVAAAPSADVQKILVQQLQKLRSVELGVEVNSLVSTFSNQFNDFLKSRDDILDQVNAGWSSTIEYNNERRPALPSISNIRFIAEKGAYGGSIDLTANASLSFLNSTLPGTNTGRIRDFRFAGQLDVPLGNVARTGKFFLSFAGLYERLVNDETLSNGTIVAPKGDIATGQVKLTIPIRGTAFKIPLSFSFANRTELIEEKHVKGSFGFTFDLDSIFAKFNPFNQN